MQKTGMHVCGFCGREIKELKKCRRCGGMYCDDCINPLTHNCVRTRRRSGSRPA